MYIVPFEGDKLSTQTFVLTGLGNGFSQVALWETGIVVEGPINKLDLVLVNISSFLKSVYNYIGALVAPCENELATPGFDHSSLLHSKQTIESNQKWQVCFAVIILQ